MTIITGSYIQFHISTFKKASQISSFSEKRAFRIIHNFRGYLEFIRYLSIFKTYLPSEYGRYLESCILCEQKENLVVSNDMKALVESIKERIKSSLKVKNKYC